ncbi:hypothetical protein DPMN_022381 [Dreissena polymorpha]|uniref:Uncharacterized protein n=1 Tax=Dreissena polymorpha TaxID=45954 RepID=A0A9D4NK92_DREPO|nr:hypothetical protein DPMN_022381 [Dreissena polymorpha]
MKLFWMNSANTMRKKSQAEKLLLLSRMKSALSIRRLQKSLFFTKVMNKSNPPNKGHSHYVQLICTQFKLQKQC